MLQQFKIRKFALFLSMGLVLLFFGSRLIRRSQEADKIFMRTLTQFDDYVYDKKWEAAKSLFVPKPSLAEGTDTLLAFDRYCIYMSQFIPEFKDAYAYFSEHKDAIVGAFRRKNMNDLKNYYFLDVILVKQNGRWLISQMRIPDGFEPPEELK